MGAEMKANMLILILLLLIAITDAAGKTELIREEKEFVRSKRALSRLAGSDMTLFSLTSFRGNEQFRIQKDNIDLKEEKNGFETNLVPDIWVNNLGKLKKSEIEPILIKLDRMTNETL